MPPPSISRPVDRDNLKRTLVGDRVTIHNALNKNATTTTMAISQINELMMHAPE